MVYSSPLSVGGDGSGAEEVFDPSASGELQGEVEEERNASGGDEVLDGPLEELIKPLQGVVEDVWILFGVDAPGDVVDPFVDGFGGGGGAGGFGSELSAVAKGFEALDEVIDGAGGLTVGEPEPDGAVP